MTRIGILQILANKVVDHHYQKPSALYVAREEVEVALASLWAAPVATQEAVRTFHNKLNRGSLAFRCVPASRLHSMYQCHAMCGV